MSWRPIVVVWLLAIVGAIVSWSLRGASAPAVDEGVRPTFAPDALPLELIDRIVVRRRDDEAQSGLLRHRAIFAVEPLGSLDDLGAGYAG